jgi:hypothetical protein
MDILSWTKLNPNIHISHVNRRFYNQYYYKLEVMVTGSGFLRDPESSIIEQAENRKKRNELRKINFGGSWRHNRAVDPTDHDLQLLQKIRTAQQKYKSLKLRIEEPRFQVYSTDEDELYKFASDIVDSNNQHIVSLFKPTTADHLALLKQGYTISRKPANYPIKAYVREGRYTLQTKSQVLGYLKAMPEEVYMPKHFIETFTKEYESVWNCYFYIKDRSILTMLALICPSLIRTTEEYHLSPEDK